MYLVVLSGFLAQGTLKPCKSLALNMSWSNISKLSCVWQEESGYELGSYLLSLVVFILCNPFLVGETAKCFSPATFSS